MAEEPQRERDGTPPSSGGGAGGESDAAAAARKLGPPLKPSAFIFHESRVGSTLAANLLAAVPSHLVYSEGMRLPESRKASRAALREALRDYVAPPGAPTARACATSASG